MFEKAVWLNVNVLAVEIQLLAVQWYEEINKTQTKQVSFVRQNENYLLPKKSLSYWEGR